MNRLGIRILLIAAIAMIVITVVWGMFGPLALWLAGPDLNQLDAKDRIAAIGTIRGQIATVLSAAFVAGGLYYTGRKFVLDRDKQYTDRYNSAVDHLGSADVTVRAGGIRALERILHDSPRDRARVLKTVTGYLRTHTTITPDNQSAPFGIPDDVAAAVDTLSDRGAPPRGEQDRLDLRGVRLAHADLTGIALRNADLGGADLSHADLRHADLRGARLDAATAHKTDFTSATLAGALATKATLTDARLDEADLRDCDLSGAALSGAVLGGTLLSGAILTSADLSGTDLRTVLGLVADQLRRTRTDTATALPPDVGKPASH